MIDCKPISIYGMNCKSMILHGEAQIASAIQHSTIKFLIPEGSTATWGGNQELGRNGATVYGDEIKGGRGTGAAHQEEDDGELVRGRG